MTYDPIDTNATDNTADRDVTLQSLSTDQIQSASRGATVVVHQHSGGDWVADGQDTEIASGQDPVPVIQAALDDGPGTVVVSEPLTITSTISMGYGKDVPRTLRFLDTVTLGADIKGIDTTGARSGTIEINTLDMADTGKVGVSVETSEHVDVLIDRLKGVPSGTFDEDDGSGNGTQSYPRCGVRVKGIEGDYGCYYTNIRVRRARPATDGTGTAIDIRTSTPSGNQKPNQTAIYNPTAFYFDRGVNVETGVSCELHRPELSLCNTGLFVGNDAGKFHIYGSGFIENCTTAIDNNQEVMIHGNIQYSGSSTVYTDPENFGTLNQNSGIPSDFVADRSAGTWYQNSGDRAIVVYVEVRASSSGDDLDIWPDVNWTTDPNLAFTDQRTAQDGTDRATASFTVPSGAYYRVRANFDGGLGRWTEQGIGTMG